MKLSEGYNRAASLYGEKLASKMIKAGIPKNFCEAACRFTREGVPLKTLQDDFKKWNRYILHNPAISNGDAKNIGRFKTYQQFKSVLESAMKPFICPNPIYDDGNLSIGELKSQKDARWFPYQNLAYPEDNNDFCICKKAGGYMSFQKYRNVGRRMFIIYDKSLPNKSPFKRVLMMSKNGELYFWNNFDKPCGTTSNLNDPIWRYIDSLPHKAQIALSEISEELKESKSNKDMKKTINEAQLKQIVAESVKRVLREAEMGRGTNHEEHSTGSYRDEYGSLSYYEWNKTENKYASDIVQMMANRLEKISGFRVIGYANRGNSRGENAVENAQFVFPTVFDNFDDILKALTAVKKLFGQMNNGTDTDDAYPIRVNSASPRSLSVEVPMMGRLNGEPRKDMLPKRGTDGYTHPNINSPIFGHWTEN